MTQTRCQPLCNSTEPVCSLIHSAQDNPQCNPPDGLELSLVCRAIARPAAGAIHRRLVRLAETGALDWPSVDAVFTDLTAPLWQGLFGIVSRSMVVELAAAQSTDLLQGDTEAERYDFFIDCLADEAFALSVLEDCPSLHLLVETFTRNWRDAVSEMLDHLAEDLARLKSHFFPARAPGAIVRIAPSQGDRHRHGRSVAMIEFETGQKLVYKPRPLAAEVAFAQFADWFNSRAGDPLLSPVEALDCGDHGWSAFVAPHPLACTDDLDTYYFRLGALLAVVRVLGLSDLHAENLIAAGAWPTIIDLETLFHPAASRFKSSGSAPPAGKRLRDSLDRSVLASGLLPVRAPQSGADTIELDLAGMSDSAGQTIPFDTPHWEKCGTDEMAIGFARQTLAGNANLPVLDGKRMPPEPFADHLLSGFRHAYRILCDNKAPLLAEDGPLASFKDISVRVVVRPTAHYAALLQDGTHPTVLQSAAYRSTWLRGRLKAPDASPDLDGLANSEISALLRHDIPYFETSPDGCALRACDGMTRPQVLPESGLDASKKTIAALGASDLSLQVWLIGLCLTKAGSSKHTLSEPLKAPQILTSPKKDPTTDLAYDIAHRSAETIAASAFSGKGNATWTSVQEGQGGTLVCAPAGLDLYSGLPGIALFMSFAGSVLNHAEYRACARAAWREVLDTLDHETGPNVAIGAYSGHGGLTYALVTAQQLHPDLPMAAAVQLLLNQMDLSAPERLPLEMIDGLAGLISCLSAMPQASTAGAIEDILTKACRAVVTKLAALERGETVDPVLLQVGAAHGLAGLKGALAGVLRHNGPGLANLADKALSCLERLSADTGDTETREPAAQRIAWCNGQAGLLATGLLHEQADLHLVRSVIARLRARDYRDDSLCHGSMGAVLALDAAKRLCLRPDRQAIECAVRPVLTRILEHGPKCGTIHSMPTPGLMDGLAGIGFAALALVDPDAVPALPGLSVSGLHSKAALIQRPNRF